MTEDEAKTKTCCGPSKCGKWVGNDRLCIGSACMGWRQSRDDYRTKRHLVSYEEYWDAIAAHNYKPYLDAIKEAEMEGGWHSLDGDLLFGWSNRIGRNPIPCGYCGLAGRP